MVEADGILLGSPVYFGSATGLMKAFIERVGELAVGRDVFTGKVGGPLVVARRAGRNLPRRLRIDGSGDTGKA